MITKNSFSKIKKSLESNPRPFKIILIILFVIALISYLLASHFVISYYFENCIINNIQCTNIVNILAILLFVSIAIVFFILLFFSIREFLVISKRKKDAKKMNKYFGLALFMITFILLIGIGIYSVVYESPLPSELKFKENDLNLSLKGYYKGVFFPNFPVYSDKIYYNIIIENPTNTTYIIREFEIKDYEFSSGDMGYNITQKSGRVINNFSDFYLEGGFPVGDIGIRFFIIKMKIESEDEKMGDKIKTNAMYYTSITSVDYEKIKQEKITILFILLSVGIFSVFSVVNNIKNIMKD